MSSYQHRGELVSCLLKHYRTHGAVSPLPRSGRPTKFTREIMDVIESTMQSKDETTAQVLKMRLHRLDISISTRTVLKGREHLSCIYRGSAYCQLIRGVNKQKCLEWVWHIGTTTIVYIHCQCPFPIQTFSSGVCASRDQTKNKG